MERRIPWLPEGAVFVSPEELARRKAARREAERRAEEIYIQRDRAAFATPIRPQRNK